jgi:hypothetical protein
MAAEFVEPCLGEQPGDRGISYSKNAESVSGVPLVSTVM